MRNLVTIWLLMALSLGAHAEQTFEADSTLAKLAEKRAEELVQFAAAQFNVKLDGSEDSIELLDPLLDNLHQTYVEEQPPEEQLLPIAHGFGSYIGEVYRRHHYGTWGWISEGEAVFQGMKQENGGLFWPSAKALERIKSNEEPTISDYYHFLVIR